MGRSHANVCECLSRGLGLLTVSRSLRQVVVITAAGKEGMQNLT